MKTNSIALLSGNPPRTGLRRTLFLALALLAHCLLLNPRLLAQTVPALVNYQGRLANPDGSPLPTADYTLTFRLYDAATNGALVWGPQVFDGAVTQGHGARVPVVQGWFNVMLGPVDTNGAALSDAFNGAARYVEVTVSNRPPIAPRQQILTTPFAFQAANSAKLAGYDWSALLGTNDPVAGAIPFSKLARRQVGTNIGEVSLGSEVTTTVSQPLVETAVSSLSTSIATTGRPVMVMLTSGVTTNRSYIRLYPEAGYSEATIDILLFRNGTAVTSQALRGENLSSSGGIRLPAGIFSFIDTPVAGTNSFLIKVIVGSASNCRIDFSNVRLVAYEL
jgi:hypothetical protein